MRVTLDILTGKFSQIDDGKGRKPGGFYGGAEVYCASCGKLIWKRHDSIKRFKNHFCNTECKAEFQKGKMLRENNGHWKGGRRYSRDGYVLIYNPEHPQATQTGYVPEHRIIMEEKLGGEIPKGYIVHHLNGIRDDNRPKNLILVKINGHGTWTLVHELQERIKELEYNLTG